MSLDGIVIRNLIVELSNKLSNGKIDKIYQPEKDEIILAIRNNGQTYKLLVSASSNNPRIHLTHSTKKNPVQPPMFCMLLRKHLQGGRIVKIEQISFERILNITVQSHDELGTLKEMKLIVEIMGRHSNIILTDVDNNKIIDSVKRITPYLSSVRQILPGLIYELPTNQCKVNPLEVSDEDFRKLLNTTNEGVMLYKFFYQNFMGISPLISKQICYLAKIDYNTQIGSLIDISELSDAFFNIIKIVKTNSFKPNIVINIKSNKIVAFSSIDLINHSLETEKKYFDSISDLLDEYYVMRDNSDRIGQKSVDLKKVISIKLERSKNKFAKQKDELLEAEKREKFKIYGDLIISNSYNIKNEQHELICQNYYSESYETVKIKLDPKVSPSKNAQRYYKKYNKLKNAFNIVSKEILKTKDDIVYLENVLLSIENCNDINELEEVRYELRTEGFIKAKNKNKNKKQNIKVSDPKCFISSDGYKIYVGKNNRQNDYLTMKLAKKSDLWLHTKDIPGSHVIVESIGDTIPDNTIVEAAVLAAYHSKAKMSTKVPVDYTERKNVKKPKGSKPGMVIYENNYTVYVNPDETIVNKLKTTD